MIEKFNFYDVYGYLIPGLILLALLWMPFGLFLHQWPPAELTSAILALVFAYILGHLIQITALAIVPPKIKDPFGELRLPSDILLDSKSLFSENLQKKIADRCKKQFEIEISPGKDPGNTAEEQVRKISGARREAFLRARNALVNDEKKGYGEQFQGLYAMMGGMVIGLGIAAFYFIGWAVAFCGYVCSDNHSNWPIGLEIALAIPVAIFAILSQLNESKKDQTRDHNAWKKADDLKKRWEKALALNLALVGLWGGVLAGCRALMNAQAKSGREQGPWIMVLLAVGAVVIAIRLFGTYRTFAKEWAVTVWRDFGDLAAPPAAESPLH
jgi:hypothetical protein